MTETETFVGSIGLIRDQREDGTRWLVHKPENREHYSLIQAERLGDESWRDCLDREITWLLELVSGRDYIISSVARLRFDTELAERGGSVRYVVEFYVVDLYGSRGKQALDNDAACRWVRTAELTQGTLEDGKTVNPIHAVLLSRSGILVGC